MCKKIVWVVDEELEELVIEAIDFRGKFGVIAADFIVEVNTSGGKWQSS